MSEYTLFISHSSRDKPLVHQLCANLIANGFNVWLDDLSALPGDSLREKILEGVDASDFVLAVLSERAMQSEWVMEELKAATTREKEERRKIIIPLVIGEVNPVPVIGDRIYIRFDQGIYGALSDLLSALDEYGVERNPSNFIPLLFDAGSELDRALFQKRLLSINNSEGKLRVWDVRDNLYSSLRKALLEKAEESSEARNLWRQIDSLEKALQTGVIQLIERAGKTGENVTETAYWFCRILRFSILGALKKCTPLIDRPANAYELTHFDSPPYSYKPWERFYSSDDIRGLAIFDKDEKFAYRVQVPATLRLYQEVRELLGYPQPLKAFWDLEFKQKYVWPQRLYYSTVLKSPEPMPWEPDDLLIGIP